MLPQKAGLVAEAASRLRLPTDRAAVRDLAAEVEWAKVSLLTPDTYAAAARRAGRDPAGQDPTAVARLLEGYEQAKEERGVIDFEDVLLVTAGVLQENPQIAQTVIHMGLDMADLVSHRSLRDALQFFINRKQTVRRFTDARR